MRFLGMASATILVVWASTAQAQTVLSSVVGSVSGQLLGRVMTAVGDVNNDGRGDYAVASTTPAGTTGGGWLYMVSGANGSILFSRSGNGTGHMLGVAITHAGDADVDGIMDIVVSQSPVVPVPVPLPSTTPPSPLLIISGATGAIIRSLAPPTGASGFGTSLANAGDRNLDGSEDFLVGAYNSNSAFLIDGFTGGVLMTLSGPAGSRFGSSVATIGDLNGDGVGELIVGAPTETFGTMGSVGTIAIFDGSNGSLLRMHSGALPGDSFGTSIAALPDVDQDGFPDYCVGASSADVGGLVNAGAVSVFSGLTGALIWSRQGTQGFLSTNTADLGMTMGSSVAYAGDLNNDAVPDVLIGSSGFNGAFEDCGLLEACSGSNGSVLGSFAGSAADDGTGSGAGALGDVDLDGWSEVLAGSTRFDAPGLSNAGLVQVVAFGPFLGPCANGASSIVHLEVNGSEGGVAHRVDIGMNAPIDLTVLNLSLSPLPADFLMFAKVGTPGPGDVTAIPGVGSMCFAPSLLSPLDPSLFLLATSYPGIPALIPATSATWSVTLPPLGIPVRVALQCVISFPPGNFWVSNAVLANIR